MKLKLNTSLKHHTLVGLLISLWLVLFLILIAPFDIAELDFAERLEVLPPYGIICFVNYMILILVQNQVFKRLRKWTIAYEVVFIIVFNIIQIIGSYAYYQTKYVNGEYNFQTFLLYVYVPISLVLLSIIVFSRWFLNRKVPNKGSQTITLKGDNKLDILKVLPEDLVCVSSADNYVEVHYLIKGILHKKLLRSTLKKIQEDIPDLMKVHRSHLINPIHFKEWNGSNHIKLTEMEVPVSKNYKSALIELN